MPPRAALLSTLLVALALTACGHKDATTPVACLGPGGDYQRALQSAPDQVALAGDTPISDCLIEAQGGGDLAQVGSAMVVAATRLNREALKDPTGPSTLQLGYLIGAAQRGAEDTAGIHTDLIRRLNTAARFSPSGTPSAAFERTFGRGYAAGREDG
jgi:hypothetical protein